MRVLVSWGSKRGGTEGIADTLAAALCYEGLEVELWPPGRRGEPKDFDAAIVGGSLYANRWHPDARRFVRRHEAELRRVPVWFFSSGPLDDSAERATIPPPRQVRALMESVGAQGHMTFGGRLSPDAGGFPAAAMARTKAGDWRSPPHIQAWASQIARALPAARPGVAIAQRGGSLVRLAVHAAAGWAVCAVTMLALLSTTSHGAALALHTLAVPVVFALVARHYFRPAGAREPLPTALAFAGVVALLDLVVVAGWLQHSLIMFTSVAGSWLPLSLVFAVTWATGEIMSMLPFPTPPAKGDAPGPGHGDLHPQGTG